MNIKKRQEIERRIVRKVAEGLIAAGYAVTVDYGMDEPGIAESTNIKAIMAEVMACDEEWLVAMKADESGQMKRAGMVFLVYGNDGWDVINDYSVSLEPALQAANALADQLERQYA